jgi:hypothetical protein
MLGLIDGAARVENRTVVNGASAHRKGAPDKEALTTAYGLRVTDRIDPMARKHRA